MGVFALPVVYSEVKANEFVGMSKRNLKDIELRLLGEVSCLRTESKRLRQRLATARSQLAEARFRLSQVEEALRLESVVEFHTVIDVTPVIPIAERKKVG